MTVEIEQPAEETPEVAVETISTDDPKGQYQKGDPLRFVRVRFPGNSKSFPFMIGDRYFQYGQKIIAPSDRGMALGYINSFPYEVPFQKSMLPLKYINKVATEKDIEEDCQYIDRQKNAEVICIDLIEKYKLDMNITHVEFTQFGKKAVLYFTAPSRVDFRLLVKELVTQLKTRIELRQISGRDRAAAIGGIGICGRQLCCSSFLQKYGNASIKMAKNQSMMLVGNRINGVCGQLKCCIQYEDEVYSYKRRALPKEGSIIKLLNGDCGKVLRLEILAEHFTFLTDKGVKKLFAVDQYDHKNSKPGDDYKFPQRFEHISDESSTLITNKKATEVTSQASMIQMLKDQSGDAVPSEDKPTLDKPESEPAVVNTNTENKKPANSNRNKNNRNRNNKNRRPKNGERPEQGQQPAKNRNNPHKTANKPKQKPDSSTKKGDKDGNSFTYQRRKPE